MILIHVSSFIKVSDIGVKSPLLKLLIVVLCSLVTCDLVIYYMIRDTLFKVLRLHPWRMVAKP